MLVRDRLMVMKFGGGLLYLIMPVSFRDLDGFLPNRIRLTHLSVQGQQY